MENLVSFGCKNCGSPHLVDRKDGKLECLSCRRVFEKDVESSAERDERIHYLSRLDDAEKRLRISPPEFDKAESLFQDFIRHYPKHSDGYWGLVRARYEIKFEKDVTGKDVPSCYKSTFDDIREDSEFLKALKFAENDQTYKKYKDMAELIAKECKEWSRITEKEKGYDVFISFKATDDATNRSTADLEKMRNLDSFLREKGYRVFFSPVSMLDKGGKLYDPYIMHALKTAKVIIVYGSKPEYFTSTWVQNEWTRYLKMMANGEKEKGSCLVAYNGFNPNELPYELKKLQAYDASKDEFYHLLVEKINSILNSKNNIKNEAKLAAEKERLEKKEHEDAKLKEKQDAVELLKKQNELDKQLEEQRRIAQQNEARAKKEKELADRKKRQEEQKEKLIVDLKNAKYKLQNGLKNIKNAVFAFVSNNKKAVIISSVSLLVVISSILLIKGLADNLGAGGPGNGDDGYYDEEDDGSCAHVFGDWIVVKDATENAEGEKKRVCNECGFEDKEPIPQSDHVHTVEILHAVEATCSSNGKTEGSYCTTCDILLVAQEVVISDHKFEGDACKYCGTTDKPSVGLAMEKSVDGYVVVGIGDCLDEKIVIPMTKSGLPVTAITYSAFANNDSITEVVIPNSIKFIGQNAFEGCDNLKKVTVNGSLSEISQRAFWKCASLSEFAINGSVKEIGGGAFYGCTSLKEINLPAGIEAIEDPVEYNYKDYGAFEGCTALTKVTIGDESSEIMTTIGKRAFYGCTKLEEVTLGNGVTKIGEFAFMESGVKTLTLGENLEVIGGGAFCGCRSLVELTIPENVKAINDKSYISNGYGGGSYYGAFENCESLKKITIEGDLDRIGTMAFWQCKSLSELIINGSVKDIGGGAFYGCTSLKEVTLPAGIEVIEDPVEYNYNEYGAFEGCTALTKVTIGDESAEIKITIGQMAFYGCTKLEEVTLGNGVTKIGEFAFMETGIKTLKLGEGLEVICGGAFYGCKSLVEVIIPESVIAIDDSGYISKGYTKKYCGAFENCTALVRVEIKGATDTIGDQAFAGCVNLSEVHIGKNVDRIGSKAFINCPSLSSINYYGAEAEWENVDNGDEWCDTPDTLEINYLN